MISASQFERRHSALSVNCKKVYAAVPISEPWSVSYILSEIQRLSSFTSNMRVVTGSLNALKASGLILEPETRRDNHNRHFHSLIGQISQQLGATVPGLADAEDAKRILISAFRIDTRNDSDLAGEWAKFGDVRMGRGLRRELEPVWAADTRRKLLAMGLWPKGVPVPDD